MIFRNETSRLRLGSCKMFVVPDLLFLMIFTMAVLHSAGNKRQYVIPKSSDIHEQQAAMDIHVKDVPGGVIYRKSGVVRLLKSNWHVYIVLDHDDRYAEQLKKEARRLIEAVNFMYDNIHVNQTAPLRRNADGSFYVEETPKQVIAKGTTRFKKDLRYFRRRLFNMVRIRAEEAVIKPGHGRSKRGAGLLPFLGSFISGITGLSTHEETQQVKKLALVNRDNLKQVYHQQEEMITVINASNHAMIENRKQINNLTSTVKIIDREWRQTVANILEFQMLAQVIGKVRDAVTYLEFEHVKMGIQDSKDNHLLDMLYAGRLTRDMIGQKDFDKVNRIARERDYGEVLPVDYYYTNGRTMRVPDEKLVIYKVRIPLVEKGQFALYSVDSLKLPLNGTETLKIDVPPQVAVSGQRNDIFIPSICLDHAETYSENQILVCNPIHSVTEAEKACINSILTMIGINKKCKAQVEIHVDESTIVEPAGPNQFYLTVFKQFFAEVFCRDQLPKKVNITRGIHLITLNGRCTMIVEGLELRAIINLSSRITMNMGSSRIVPIYGLIPLYMKAIEDGDIYKHDTKMSPWVQEMRKIGVLPHLQPNVMNTLKPLELSDFTLEPGTPWKVYAGTVVGICIIIFMIALVSWLRLKGFCCYTNQKEKLRSMVERVEELENREIRENERKLKRLAKKTGNASLLP